MFITVIKMHILPSYSIGKVGKSILDDSINPIVTGVKINKQHQI